MTKEGNDEGGVVVVSELAKIKENVDRRTPAFLPIQA
jgi:hypothetical protein